MELGTKVKNPVIRHGKAYSECTWCHKLYTSMGIPRHWDHCPDKPKQIPLPRINLP